MSSSVALTILKYIFGNKYISKIWKSGNLAKSPRSYHNKVQPNRNVGYLISLQFSEFTVLWREFTGLSFPPNKRGKKISPGALSSGATEDNRQRNI